MSAKNIKLTTQKAVSYDDKKIRHSQFSDFRKDMADQLRREIDTLLPKSKFAGLQARKSYEEHKFWKSQGIQAEADNHWMSYQMWSDENHRLGERIIVLLKAVQKYQSSNKMEEPKIIDKKNQYLKYGPSDDEEEQTQSPQLF